MKIRHLKVSAVLLAATLLTSSCVGSFSLFNKLAGWNKDATGNKFLNELIFILISPAYAVCTVADVLVLNTIEFWTGSNPVAQRVGTTQEITGKDGKLYAKMTLPVTIEDATMNVEAVFGTKPAAGINGITTTQNGKVEVYNVNGVRLNGLQKGLNIVRTADGKVVKVLK